MHEHEHAPISYHRFELFAKQVERRTHAGNTRRRYLSTDRKVPRLGRHLVIHGFVPPVLAASVLTHDAHELPIREPFLESLRPHFDLVDKPKRQHLRKAFGIVHAARESPGACLHVALDIRQLVDVAGELHELKKALPVGFRSLRMLTLGSQERFERLPAFFGGAFALPASNRAWRYPERTR